MKRFHGGDTIWWAQAQLKIKELKQYTSESDFKFGMESTAKWLKVFRALAAANWKRRIYVYKR